MLAIQIPFDPDIFMVGGFRLTWHSLFAVLGILAGVFVARRIARRTIITEDQVTTLALWGVAGSIVVARFLYVIDNTDRFAGNFWSVFALNQGGITVWGALIGGALAVALSGWWQKLPLRAVLDVGSAPLIFGMAIGRIGDLINGEHIADAADLPWAVFYTHANTLGQGPGRPDLGAWPVHPATTYELLGDLAIFAIALWLTWRFLGRGYGFWMVLGGYSALRFGLQFIRLDQPEHFWGLAQSQIIGVLGMIVTAIWLARRLIGGRTAPTAESTQERQRKRRTTA